MLVTLTTIEWLKSEYICLLFKEKENPNQLKLTFNPSIKQ